MTGGFLQLVARNTVDLYLIGTPQITYFKTVYRRHTNFTFEDRPLKFKGGNLNFGKTSECTLETFGDMIHRLNLMVTLPEVDIVYQDLTVCNVSKLLKEHKINFKSCDQNILTTNMTNIQYLEANDAINQKVSELQESIKQIDNIIDEIRDENPQNNLRLTSQQYFDKLANIFLINSDYRTIYNFLIAHQNDFGQNIQDENLTNADEVGLSIFRDFQRGAILRAATESDITLFPLLTTLTTTIDETVQIMTLFDSVQSDITESVDAEVFYQNIFSRFFPDDPLENYKKFDAYKFYQIYVTNNPISISTKSELLDFKDTVIDVVNCSFYESFRITTDYFKQLVKNERFQITFDIGTGFRYFDPVLPSSISNTSHIKFINYDQDPFIGYENGTITCNQRQNYKRDYNQIASQKLGEDNVNFANSIIFENYLNDEQLWIGYDIGTILFTYPPVDINGDVRNDILERFTELQDTVIFNSIINITINDIGEALKFYIYDFLNKGNGSGVGSIEDSINKLNRILFGYENYEESLLDRLLPIDETLDGVIESRQLIGLDFRFLHILNPRGDFNNFTKLLPLVEDPNKPYNAYELLRFSYYKLINSNISISGTFTNQEINNMKSVIDMFFIDNLPSYGDYVDNGYSLYEGTGVDPFFNTSGPLFGTIQSSIARLIYLNQRLNYNRYCLDILNNISSGVSNGTTLQDFVNDILSAQLSQIEIENGIYDFFALREYTYTDRDNNLITNFRVANDGLTANQFFTNVDNSSIIFTNTYFYFTGAYPWSFFIDSSGNIPDDVKAETEVLIKLVDFNLERRRYFYGFFNDIIDGYNDFLNSIPNLNLSFFTEIFAYFPQVIINSMGVPEVVIQAITTSSDIKSSAQLKGLSKAPMDTLTGDSISFSNSIKDTFFDLITTDTNPFDSFSERSLFQLWENIRDSSYNLNINQELELFEIVSNISSTSLWNSVNQLLLRFNNLNYEKDLYNYLNFLVLEEANLGILTDINKLSNLQIFEDIIDNLLEERRIQRDCLEEIIECGVTTNEQAIINMYKKILTSIEYEILKRYSNENYRIDFINLLVEYGLKDALVDKLDTNNNLLDTSRIGINDAFEPLLNIISGIELQNSEFKRVSTPIELKSLNLWYDEIDRYFRISETSPISGGRNYTNAENLARGILVGSADTFYKRIDDQFFSNEWQLINLLLEPTSEEYYLRTNSALPISSYNNFDKIENPLQTHLLFIRSRYDTLPENEINYYGSYEEYFRRFYDTLISYSLILLYKLEKSIETFFLSNKPQLMKSIINAFNGKKPNFAWVKKIGFFMIESIKLFIDDQEIDSQTGEWMYLWWLLTRKPKKDRGLLRMIGDYPELTDFNNSIKQETKLYTPLYFWFSRHSELSLPLIALNHARVRVDINIRNLDELCYYEDFTRFRKTPKLEGKILTNYIILEEKERNIIAKTKQEQIIELVQLNKGFSINPRNVDENGILEKRVYFHDSVKEFIWVFQNRKNINGSMKNNKRDYETYGFDFGDTFIPKGSVEIFFNGRYRDEERSNEYYNYVNPYKYHNSTPVDGVNMYSFALKPEKLQPSGTANLSMIDFVDFRFKFDEETLLRMKREDLKFDIRIYGHSYNILRIASGLAGLAFYEN
ncbi:MAG: hypothetical protein CMF62_00195 [Magnetococcales bacterium]|nr:hypothetical protein [Magnetococcales bacterium]|tara:strand:- start:9550 stop:14433 length:4884 start_codon:yes stop_codon:yes gene_type:complete